MSLPDILRRNPNLTVRDLQELQGMYDEKFIAGRFTGFNKVRHTYAHLGKLMGRLAGYIEAIEEGRDVPADDIKNKVIPDLLVYSAWLAKEFDVDMEQAYLTRVVCNIKRLYADKIPHKELLELEKLAAKRRKK